MDNLKNWRKQINTIDKQILNLLARRLKLSQKIGQYKKEQKLPVLDQVRWTKVLKSNLDQAESLNLSKDFIRKIFTLIHKDSISIQKNIKP